MFLQVVKFVHSHHSLPLFLLLSILPYFFIIKTTSVNWWFALRLKAFITDLSLKGSLNGLPYAPHPRTDSLRISYSYLFLFRCPVNGSYSSNNVRDRKSTRLNSSHVS